MRKTALTLAVAVPGLLLLSVLVYSLPPVHDRLAWRLENLQAQVRYAINPPEAVVFVPQEKDFSAPEKATLEAVVQSTLGALATPTPPPTETPAPTNPGPTGTPTLSPTPAPSPTPLPPAASLKGIVHEYQKWNNCGPANLAMELSFWGWQGDQLDTAAVLKPNPRDKNVMPYEMADFVNTQTGLRAVTRLAGDLELLKSFLAAGFPVIVEKGFEGASFDGWMGHYEVVSGYDDARQRFTVQDSYIKANLPIPYADMEAQWRAFNYVFVVVYPPEREGEVQSILGADWDETANYQHAAEKAAREIQTATGRDLYFAWYNRGTSLMDLQDYNGAVDAYNQAFAVYPTIPEKQRPWRMLWYQTGPYFAYYFTQDYWNLVSLATTTLANASEPAIEESYYWRGRAFYALYQLDGNQDHLTHAVDDLRASLKWHPDFGPTLSLMQTMGVSP